MTDTNKRTLQQLLEKGVKISSPDSLEIGDEVNPDRISADGVIIHSGCRIYGKETLILPGAVLGYEAPVTIENCYIGPNVKLNGGYFRKAVFLKNASFGSCAHVREGTILEEEASAAHAVGLKQTILFPYVTLGSLINFCDCMMTGGTDKKNHSEVGSSYIHFNFTPQQDKATPSLIGDVPSGVMLDQPPIFLGGQGGLVGPTRLTFGITSSAGTILRKDELRPNRLIMGGAGKGGNISFVPGVFSNVKRIFSNNIIYISNLFALMHWYQNVRFQFVSEDFPEDLHHGLIENLTAAINERIKRLDEYVDKLSRIKTKKSASDNSLTDEVVRSWPQIHEKMEGYRLTGGDEALKNRFLNAIALKIRESGNDYLKVIAHLKESDKDIGRLWLSGIVAKTVSDVMGHFSFFDSLAIQ